MMEVEVGDVVIMKGGGNDEFNRVLVRAITSYMTFEGAFLIGDTEILCYLARIDEEKTKLYQERYGKKFTGQMRVADKVELSTDQGDET